MNWINEESSVLPLFCFLSQKGRRKKRKTHLKEDPNAAKDIPRSFVLSSGAVTKSVKHLVHDFRLVMEPNTATRLKVY